jgi:hypothetical protein
MKLQGSVILVVVLALVAMGSIAQASEIQFDTNRFTGQAYTGSNGTGSATSFSTSHTGSVAMSFDSNSFLNGITLDSTAQSFSGWAMSAFTMYVNYTAGQVTGGTYSIAVTKSTRTDSFTANIFDGNGAGADILYGAGKFTSAAGLKDGTFTTIDDTFAGVGISNFLAQNQTLWGDLVYFDFAPTNSGYDADSDVDASILVPLPSALWGGFAMLLGLGFSHIRRRKMA